MRQAIPINIRLSPRLSRVSYFRLRLPASTTPAATAAAAAATTTAAAASAAAAAAAAAPASRGRASNPPPPWFPAASQQTAEEKGTRGGTSCDVSAEPLHGFSSSPVSVASRGRRHQHPHTRHSSCHRRPGSFITFIVPGSSPLVAHAAPLRGPGIWPHEFGISARRAGAGNRSGQSHAAMNGRGGNGVMVRGDGLGRLTPRRSDSCSPAAWWTYASRDTQNPGMGAPPEQYFKKLRKQCPRGWGGTGLELGRAGRSRHGGPRGDGDEAVGCAPRSAPLPTQGWVVRETLAFPARPTLSLVPSSHAVPCSLQTSACAMLPVGGGGCGRSRLSARPLVCLTRVCLPPRPCSGSKQTDAADPEAGAPACAVLEACARGQGRDHLWQGKGQARHHPQNLPPRTGTAAHGALRLQAPLPLRSRCWRGSHKYLV